jgi:hypothetical protein
MFNWSIVLGARLVPHAPTPFFEVGVQASGLTVTVVCCVTAFPAVFVTVRVNVVVAERFPVEMGTPELTAPSDGFTDPVPFEKIAVRVVAVPEGMLEVDTVKEAMAGAAMAGAGVTPPLPQPTA